MDLIVDANIIMHFRRLDELDWPKISGKPACRVIITPALIREVERNKVHNPNSKLRSRAAGSVRWIAKLIDEPDPILIGKGATLVLDDQDALIDFSDYQLNRDIADDHLIAAALDWQMRTGNEVAILTDDTGLALKLRSRPIALFRLNDEWRLPDAIDAERKELNELKRELEKERSRRPKLVLRFEDGEITVNAEPFECDEPRSLENVRAINSPFTMDEYRASDRREIQGARVYEQLVIDRFNEELEAYFGEYAEYLGKFKIWHGLQARTFEFAFALSNLGSAPANNLDVKLSFPSSLEVIDPASDLAEPLPPPLPRKPVLGEATILVPRVISLGRPIAPIPFQDGEPHVSQDGSSVSYHIEKLKHDHAAVLDPILVRFPIPTEFRGFAIDVAITCNEGDRVTDKLNVKIVT